MCVVVCVLCVRNQWVCDVGSDMSDYIMVFVVQWLVLGNTADNLIAQSDLRMQRISCEAVQKPSSHVDITLW